MMQDTTITTEMLEAELVRLRTICERANEQITDPALRGWREAHPGEAALNDRKAALLRQEYSQLRTYVAARKECDEAGV